MKHIQLQQADSESYGHWFSYGEVVLFPDGRIQRADNSMMDYFVRDKVWHEAEGSEVNGRYVTIREPEFFLETWVKLGPDHGQRVIDVDNPATADDLLPLDDGPFIIGARGSIVPEWEALSLR